MSVQYFLDGYNAVNQIPHLAQKTIREAREGLVRLVETGGFSGSPRNEVTIVFDGQAGIVYFRKPSGTKVIFSAGETADDLIKRLVERSGNKKNVYVITDDKGLSQNVRDFGAKTVGVKEFFARPHEKRRAVLKAKKGLEEKEISAVTEFTINDELKKVWLK